MRAMSQLSQALPLGGLCPSICKHAIMSELSVCMYIYALYVLAPSRESIGRLPDTAVADYFTQQLF